MPLIASCQTGMTATTLALALEVVGIKDVPVYAVRIIFIILFFFSFNFT